VRPTQAVQISSGGFFDRNYRFAVTRNNTVKCLDEAGIEASACARKFTLRLRLYVMHFLAITMA